MMLHLLLLLVYSLQLVLSQTAPQISETFTSAIRITVEDHDGKHVGLGAWAIDQPAGMGVENYKFDHDKYDVLNLQRYDLGMQYMLDPVNNTKCRSFKVNGTMPLIWSWLSLAKYLGKAGHGDDEVDIWEARIGYAVLRLGVKTSDPTHPVYLIRQSRDERKTSYEFLSFNASAPSMKYFTVPSECSSAKPDAHKISNNNKQKGVGCMNSATIMGRAKVWVANHIPYNQGGTYQGYREDCSGYVSMCWDSSQPGHVTQTMYQISKPIAKADLQAGDCLLYAAEHVVLFGGWTDSSQTHYMAYEETQPGTGTVAQTTPYPYWYSQSDFLPYRYDQFC